MSSNNTLARWHYISGRHCPARYEPPPTPTAPSDCLVSSRRPIPHHFPPSGGVSFLLRHHSQFPDFSRRPISTGAVPPAIVSRPAHPGLVHLLAIPPAPFGHCHLYHSPLPSAPHVGGTGLDRRSPHACPLSP